MLSILLYANLVFREHSKIAQSGHTAAAANETSPQLRPHHIGRYKKFSLKNAYQRRYHRSIDRSIKNQFVYLVLDEDREGR